MFGDISKILYLNVCTLSTFTDIHISSFHRVFLFLKYPIKINSFTDFIFLLFIWSLVKGGVYLFSINIFENLQIPVQE